MLETPDIAFDRPKTADAQPDVISEVLRAVRLGAEVFGRFELSARRGMARRRDRGQARFRTSARALGGGRRAAPARRAARAARSQPRHAHAARGALRRLSASDERRAGTL